MSSLTRLLTGKRGGRGGETLDAEVLSVVVVVFHERVQCTLTLVLACQRVEVLAFAQDGLEPALDGDGTAGFGDLLTKGIGSADLKVRRMCDGIDYLWPALWTYLDVPGVESTNNVAERAIRPAVLWRKGSSGTQSGSGARFAGAMLTVAATCRMHGLGLFN